MDLLEHALVRTPPAELACCLFSPLAHPQQAFQEFKTKSTCSSLTFQLRMHSLQGRRKAPEKWCSASTWLGFSLTSRAGSTSLRFSLARLLSPHAFVLIDLQSWLLPLFFDAE